MTLTERRTAGPEGYTLKPGKCIYTVLRHVSRSGMSRSISLYVMPDSGIGGYEPSPLSLDWWAHIALDLKLDQRHNGVKVSGCGGYHLVYSLGRYCFPDGFDCIGEHCPSNDHSNGTERTMMTVTNGLVQVRHHTDGGYAFTHRWL